MVNYSLYLMYILHALSLCSVHCTVYSVHCTMYIVHCTLYNVHSIYPKKKRKILHDNFSSLLIIFYNIERKKKSSLNGPPPPKKNIYLPFLFRGTLQVHTLNCIREDEKIIYFRRCIWQPFYHFTLQIIYILMPKK